MMNRIAYFLGQIVGLAVYPALFLVVAYLMWHLAERVW